MDYQAIWLTIKLASLTTALLLIFATPLAWWLAFSRSPIKPAVEAVTALPLILPPTVLGFYFLVLLGPTQGIGKWWFELTGSTLTFSFSGLVIASMVYSLPFVVQPLANAFAAMGNKPLEEAANLGAGPFDRILTLRFRARDVAIATSPPKGISIRNVLKTAITQIVLEPGNAFAEIQLKTEDQILLMRLTRASVSGLDLAIGKQVYALIKSITFDRRMATERGIERTR